MNVNSSVYQKSDHQQSDGQNQSIKEQDYHRYNDHQARRTDRYKNDDRNYHKKHEYNNHDNYRSRNNNRNKNTNKNVFEEISYSTNNPREQQKADQQQQKVNQQQQKTDQQQQKVNQQQQKYFEKLDRQKQRRKRQNYLEQFDENQLSEITTTIIKKINKGGLECSICSCKIYDDNKIWSCKCCYQIMHLKCIVKWIKNLNINQKSNNKEYVWSCPMCQYVYSEQMPKYYCYCGRLENPEEDQYYLPHSCGEPSHKRKEKDQTLCQHNCQQRCHPGPCPPCSQSLKYQFCYCGKERIQVYCGNKQSNFKCGQKCDNLLNCQKHNCEQDCHDGDCQDCQIEVVEYCYCGKTSQTRKCGQQYFACEQKCNRLLDCGNHYCQKDCHKGDCGPCLLQPKYSVYCPCGKNKTDFLIVNKRKSCLDPMPICGLPCKKLLKCKEHYCQQSCHEGECPPCVEQVEQQCKCGKTTQKIDCYKKEDPKYQFSCQKRCNKKKSCKVHKCIEMCCEYHRNSDLHICLKVCDKDLVCGNHKCGLYCHLGYCAPCPIILNRDFYCPCGNSKVNGPQKCGFKVKCCNNLCNKELQCGHRCQQQCHENECGQCMEEVFRKCLCGKHTIKTQCYKQYAKCLDLCTKQLKCGHVCNRSCHDDPCFVFQDGVEYCQQICNRFNEECGHRCQMKCHGRSRCSQKCDVQVKKKCECSNREVYIECYKSKNIQVLCNNTCKSIQRFGQLINKQSNKKPYYPLILTKVARRYPQFIQKIETQINDMIKLDKGNIEISLKQQEKNLRNAVQIYVSKHYEAELDIYWNIQKPFMIVKNTESIKIPRPNLTEYLKMVKTGKLKPDVLPFECSLRFLQAGHKDEIKELQYMIGNDTESYYLEFVSGQLFCHFWEKAVCELAAQRIKRNVSIFSNFQVVDNYQLINEDTKIEGSINNEDGIIQIDSEEQIEKMEQVEEIEQIEQTEQIADNILGEESLKNLDYLKNQESIDQFKNESIFQKLDDSSNCKTEK